MGFSLGRLWGSTAAYVAPTARKRAEHWLKRGVAAEKAQETGGALRCFEAAVDADPTFSSAHMSRGIALRALGRIDEALAAQQQAIALDPACAPAHFNLALIHRERSEPALAEARFRSGLEHQPDNVGAWLGLADLLERTGQPEEALSAWRRALAFDPDRVDALLRAGALLRRLRRLDDAAVNDRHLTELEPENTAVHERLAMTYLDLGRLPEAEAAFRAILTYEPENTETTVNLALVMRDTGRGLEAIPMLFAAVAAHPTATRAKNVLAGLLRGVEFGAAPGAERSVLQQLCADNEVSADALTQPVVVALRSHEAVAPLRRGAEADPLANPHVSSFMRDPLVLAALPSIVLADASLEEAVTHLRRCILAEVARTHPLGGGPLRAPLAFVCALARQSFLTSYAMFVTEAEREQVSRLRESLSRALAAPHVAAASLEYPLAAAAMYGRLPDMPACDWSDDFAPLVESQIVNPRRERELAANLPRLTSIEDQTSLAVRDQYEENPYPCWQYAAHSGPDSFASLWHRLHGTPPTRQPPSPLPILVAGCGTGRQAIETARLYQDAEVLAVDLSLASLGYAARMTRKLGISNITYGQADILRLGSLGRRFAIIECVGVLHHLDDPMAGWHVLRGLLEPDGLMHIALYSEKGRAQYRAARELAAEICAGYTAENIRSLRHAIMTLPPGHPAREASRPRDFFSLDECRDFLLHVCEHRFTLPQIAACLEQLDLRLLALEPPAPAIARFKEMFPDRDAKTDLAAWDRFEDANPETFFGMYFLWCGAR